MISVEHMGYNSSYDETDKEASVMMAVLGIYFFIDNLHTELKCDGAPGLKVSRMYTSKTYSATNIHVVDNIFVHI